MGYLPLTQSQWQKAIDAGFSPDQIIANEKIRKSQEGSTPLTAAQRIQRATSMAETGAPIPDQPQGVLANIPGGLKQTVLDLGKLTAPPPVPPPPQNALEVPLYLYEKYSQMPVMRQYGDIIGGAVGALGGAVGAVTGGAVAAVGKPIANMMTGQPLTKDLGSTIAKEAIEKGKSTAKFGFQEGKEAAPASTLGVFGKIPLALLATSQGAESLHQAETAWKNKDYAGFIEAGISLGLSVAALKGAWQANGKIFNKDVTGPVKQVAAEYTGLDKMASDKIANTWRDALNLPRLKVAKNAQFGKDPAQLLTDEGILPSVTKTSAGNVLTQSDVTSIVSQLDERLDPLTNASTALVKESGAYANLDELAYNAKVAARRLKTAGTDYNAAVKGIDAEVAALKENLASSITMNADGEALVPADVMNKIATDYSKKAFKYDPTKPNVLQKVDFQIGMNARNLVAEALPEDSAFQDLNAHISDLMNAKDAIQSRIGTTTKGGGVMSKLTSRIAGSVAGAGGGPVGSIIGALTADQLSTMMNNPQNRAETINAMIELSRSQKGQQLIEKASQQLLQQRAAQAATPRLQAPTDTVTTTTRGGTQTSQVPSQGIIQSGSASTEFQTRETAFPQTGTAPGGQEMAKLPTASDSSVTGTATPPPTATQLDEAARARLKTQATASLPVTKNDFAPTPENIDLHVDKNLLPEMQKYVDDGPVQLMYGDSLNPQLVLHGIRDLGELLQNEMNIPHAIGHLQQAITGQSFTNLSSFAEFLKNSAKELLSKL